MQAGGTAAVAIGGTVRPGCWEWSGPRGYAELQGLLRCSAPDPAAFRLQARTMVEQDLALVEWRSTPVKAEWDVDLREPRLCLSAVVAGECRYDLRATAWSAPAGSVGVFRCAGRVRFGLPRGGCLRSLLLPVDGLPPRLRSARRLPEGVLVPTTLVRAFAAVLRDGFGDALELGRVPSGLPQGLRGLAAAVLEEACGDVDAQEGPLREQILAFVDDHLDDVALGPQSVADALGVSVRWVHQSFSGQGTTLARHIRGRRVDAVARHVRASHQRPRLNLLAPAFGFTSRDRLTRAFSAEHGMGIGEYWESHAAGRADG